MNHSETAGMLERRYGIDHLRGFLPAADPPWTFASSTNAHSYKFIAVERLGANLAGHLRGKTLERAVHSLPLLDEGDIAPLSDRFAGLLFLRLSFITHAYVWENWNKPNEMPVRDILPANLAVPLRILGKRFGVHPLLNYWPYALWNWRRRDLRKGISPENLKLIQNFLGGESEEWFVIIHVAIELAAAAIPIPVWEIGDAIAEGNERKLLWCLSRIAGAMKEINALMRRMPEHCDTEVYFHDVRPYLNGSKNMPACPNGWLYEGRTPEESERLSLRGETGAQSRIIPCLDIALGVTHVQSSLSEHLDDMLHGCTPTKQRNFVLEIAKRSALSEATAGAGLYGKEVEKQYWEDRRLVAEFRGIHYAYARWYIQEQARRVKNPFGDKASGGTPYIPSLWKHFEETLGARLIEEMGGAKKAFETLIHPFGF